MSRRRIAQDGAPSRYATGGMVEQPQQFDAIYDPSRFTGLFQKPTLMPQPVRPAGMPPAYTPQPVGQPTQVPTTPTAPAFNFGAPENRGLMGMGNAFQSWRGQNPGGNFRDFMMARNSWFKQNMPETSRAAQMANRPRFLQPEFSPFFRGPRQQQSYAFASGGYVDGIGDGSSDHVPAMIANTGEPALLSDGEYVVPADVVAHLGNGSNKAGAKRLKSLVNTVRKEKTGSARMPKRI